MLLTVIIPVYNVAPYLARCLDSVRVAIATWVASSDSLMHASSPVAEIICIDDGSTDGSGQILDAYFAEQKASSYVARIVHKSNAGVSVARNVGLESAVGDWVMFLDSDDTWDWDLLRKLFLEIEQNPDCDAVCFSVQYSGGGMGRFAEFGCYSHADMIGDEILSCSDRGIQNTIWVIWDKVYRLATINSVGLSFTPELRIGEDSLFAQQFLAVAERVCLRPEIKGYNYFVRPESAINTTYTELPKNPLSSCECLYAWWQRFQKSGLKRLLLASIRGALQLGLGDMYAPNVAQDGIEYLLHSKSYNSDLVGFFVRHGRGEALYKFMVAYYFSPYFLKRRLLLWLRGLKCFQNRG